MEKITFDELLKQKMEEVDIQDLVSTQIYHFIREEAGSEIKKQISSEVDKMVTKEIKKVMDGEIKTDNGWGEKAVYKSFEELFKTTLANNLKSNWELQRKIEEEVRRRVDAYLKEKSKEVIDKISTDLSGLNWKK